MKRTIIAVVVAVASISAHAESWFQFEAGAGFVHSKAAGDGLWYWQGAAHSMQDNNVGVRAGIQLNLTNPNGYVPGVRAHLAYYNFGRVDWSANAGQDANTAHTMGYNPVSHSCYNGDCGTWRNFQSSGNMQAVALTIEPFWNVGNGWTVGVEAGPALFRSTWSVSATAMSDGMFGSAGTVQTFSRLPRWQFGQIVGLSVGYKHLTLRYNYLRAPVDSSVTGSASGDLAGSKQWVPSGIVGQHMVSLNYTF